MSNTNALERPYRFLNTRKKFSDDYTKKLERVWLDLNDSDSSDNHKKHIIIYADPDRKKCISFMEFFPEDWEEIDEPVLKTASSMEEVKEFANTSKDPVSVKISPEDRGVSEIELANSVMSMLEEDKPDKAQVSNDVPKEITENLEGFEDDFVTLKDTANIPVKEIMQEIKEPVEKPKKKKGLFSKIKDTVEMVIDDDEDLTPEDTLEDKSKTKTSKTKPKSKNKETDIYDINLDIDSMFDDLSKTNKPRKGDTGELSAQPESVPQKPSAEAVNGFDGYSGFKSHDEIASEEDFEEQPVTNNQTLQGLPIAGTVSENKEITNRDTAEALEKLESLVPEDEISDKDTHVFESELISAGTFAGDPDEDPDILEDELEDELIEEDDPSEDILPDDTLLIKEEFEEDDLSEDADNLSEDTDDNTADIHISELLETTAAPVTNSAKEDSIAALEEKLYKQLKDKLGDKPANTDSSEEDSSEENNININERFNSNGANYKRLNNLPEDDSSEKIQEDIPLNVSDEEPEDTDTNTKENTDENIDENTYKEIFLQSDVYESSDKPVFDFNKDYGLKELTPKDKKSDIDPDADPDTKGTIVASPEEIRAAMNNVNDLDTLIRSKTNNKENNNMNETLIKYIITEIEMQIDELRKNCNDQAIADYISSAMKTKLDTIKNYIA